MQSLIVIAKNPQKSFEYSLKICQKKGIDKLDITGLKSEKTRLVGGQAIGIEEIRDLQKYLILKPFKSSTKAVIIQNAEMLTIQAQNAMLKTLEEPPSHTLIILTTSSKELLLPTILSRCKVIELEKDDFISEKEIDDYNKLLTSLLTGSIGERLRIAQDVGKTQENAISWIEKMIISIRQRLLEKIAHDESSLISQSLNILILIKRSYVTLKTTNANPRFTLETLLLNL